MFLHQSYLWTYRFCIRAFSFPPIFLLPLLSKSKENNSESTSFFNFWVNVSSLRFVEVLLDSNIRRFLPQCITNDQCGGNTRKNQLFFTFGFFLSFVTFFLLSGVWSFRFTMEMCSILSNWCDGKVLLFVFLSLSLYFYYFLTIFFLRLLQLDAFLRRIRGTTTFSLSIRFQPTTFLPNGITISTRSKNKQKSNSNTLRRRKERKFPKCNCYVYKGFCVWVSKKKKRRRRVSQFCFLEDFLRVLFGVFVMS